MADLGTGIAFPFRIGGRGQILMTSSDFYEDTHIKESIKQILLTNKGERVMEPEFGSNLRKLLFKSNNPSVYTIAARMAAEALAKWETRIKVKNIDISGEYDTIKVEVKYIITATEQPDFTYVEFGKAGE